MNTVGLEQKIGYKFKNNVWLLTALTHSSYANEKSVPSYERIEFLGDAILDMIISEHLFKKHQVSEGELTKMRAKIVCEPALSAASVNLGVGKHIRFNRGEAHSGGAGRPSILADVFEAILAAIYLDGGFRAARKFALSNLQDTIDLAVGGHVNVDFKTTLQELVRKQEIRYEVIGEEGPEHQKVFNVQLFIDNKPVCKASGPSIKTAEKNAAELAVRTLNNN